MTNAAVAPRNDDVAIALRRVPNLIGVSPTQPQRRADGSVVEVVNEVELDRQALVIGEKDFAMKDQIPAPGIDARTHQASHEQLGSLGHEQALVAFVGNGQGKSRPT
ncbi:hypothetical protein J3U87_17580 [Sulfidibacter corallicola]|uniref:Uncharacterized protein n=1 Tax=Sulfidibacter corallicola TaxID=2818388 RepID=A0A8A4TWD9_SULCO|nr:hypothetical protein [Sulfidibacter corallicola]QTD54259.1 hypothetical protein J3U87_17580 [Sulfidibacter corallicola]